MTDDPEAPPAPATGEEITAWLFMAAGLLFVFTFHLAPALIAGFLTQKIVGGHIGAAAWETLLAIVVSELEGRGLV